MASYVWYILRVMQGQYTTVDNCFIHNVAIYCCVYVPIVSQWWHTVYMSFYFHVTEYFQQSCYSVM